MLLLHYLVNYPKLIITFEFLARTRKVDSTLKGG